MSRTHQGHREKHSGQARREPRCLRGPFWLAQPRWGLVWSKDPKEVRVGGETRGDRSGPRGGSTTLCGAFLVQRGDQRGWSGASAVEGSTHMHTHANPCTHVHPPPHIHAHTNRDANTH